MHTNFYLSWQKEIGVDFDFIGDTIRNLLEFRSKHISYNWLTKRNFTVDATKIF